MATVRRPTHLAALKIQYLHKVRHPANNFFLYPLLSEYTTSHYVFNLFFLVSDYDYFSMAGDQEPEQQPSDFDKSSTIPRNSDISQSYRLMFQSKRPASTAGLPSTPTAYPEQGAYPAGPYPSTPVHTGAYPPTPTGTGCTGSLTVG